VTGAGECKNESQSIRLEKLLKILLIFLFEFVSLLF
jgi:hypothetical protein